MDSRIDRIVTPDTFSLSRLGERPKERRFVLPRRRDGSADGSPSEPSEEPTHVLEPRPRPDEAPVTVSRERLEDEAGQRIDLQG